MNALPIGKQVSLPGHFDVPVISGGCASVGQGLRVPRPVT